MCINTIDVIAVSCVVAFVAVNTVSPIQGVAEGLLHLDCISQIVLHLWSNICLKRTFRKTHFTAWYDSYQYV